MNLQLFGILLSILLSAYFAGSETAFISFNKTRLQAWLKQKKHGTRRLNSLIQHPERFMTTLLIGNNLANVLYSSLLTLYLTERGFSENSIFILSPLILLIFGETLPKSLAHQTADGMIIFSAILLNYLRIFLLPIVKSVEWITNRLQRSLGLPTTVVDNLFSRGDITSVIYSSKLHEVLAPSEERLLHQALQLGLTRVSDIMTPRTAVDAIPSDTSISDAKRMFKESGMSRLPCYDNTIDNVIGLILAKDLLSDQVDISSIMREIPVVPESLFAIRLPALFRKHNVYLAAVIDEYGGLAGIVSLEDVIEEVVGPILDEHDKGQPRCKQLSENSWMVDGDVRLSHVNQITGIDLKSQHNNSIGGFLTEIANNIPLTGAEFYVDDVSLYIVESDFRGVRRVRITTNGDKLSVKP